MSIRVDIETFMGSRDFRKIAQGFKVSKRKFFKQFNQIFER